jgi:hypothetical protein
VSPLRLRPLTDPVVLEWRYLANSIVKHALPVGGRWGICGAGPTWYHPDKVWLGDGGQAELDRTVALPACKLCVGLGVRP